MGLFSKTNKAKSFFALFPDGREVKSGQDLKELRENFSFSPSTLNRWTIHKVDMEPFAKAAAQIASLGIPSDESIIAFGPVKLYEYPKSHNEYIAEAILTISTLVIYYYYGASIIPEYFIVELNDISGLTSHGGWTAAFSFKRGAHIKKGKIFEVNTPYFVLSELLGKDGHNNRRSVTLVDSLAKTLNEIQI
jgi:hypothetical protein